MKDKGMPEYTMADLVWVGVREFQSVGTGKFYRARNGKMKEETRGVEFVNTVGAGRMELDDWYLAMEAAIHREGRTAALAEKIDRAKTLAWLHTPEAIRRCALEMMEREVKDGKM